jgi:integrase
MPNKHNTRVIEGIAREVALDVIQAQMGHASIQTTTAIYGRAPIKRRVDELGKAFGI